MYDFIPSQPSPVKHKKTSKTSKKPATASDKVAKPSKPRKNSKAEKAKKQQLIARLNQDWGIAEAPQTEAGDSDDGADAMDEPPMSQATALRHHINDIDDNVELTIEKKNTQKHCRFRTNSTENKTPSKDSPCASNSETRTEKQTEVERSCSPLEGSSKNKKRNSRTLRKETNIAESVSDTENQSDTKAKVDSPAKKSKLAEGSACEVSNGSKRVKQVAQEPKQSPVTTDVRQRRSKRNVMSEESTNVSTAAAATLPADKIKTEIGADEESPSTIQVTQKKQSDIRAFMKPNSIVTNSTTDGDKIGLWCDA